jgi:hypothetical protein
MQIRHKIPTIFNLSMVDVLCCALGCCILLWLLNLREARERSELAGKTQHALTDTEARLKTATKELEQAAQQSRAVETERDRLLRELGSATSERDALNKSISALKADYAQSRERVRTLDQRQGALAKEKEDLNQKLSALGAQLRDKESMARTSSRRVDELTTQMRAASDRANKLEVDLQSERGKVTAMKTRVEKADRDIDTLRQQKDSLADQAARARAAVENRFEGIALRGRRVIFLVDMSGSMELVDIRTPAPDKWIGVRETLAKVMRSLPNLEKFQIIIFSEKASYLLGNDGRWLVFDPKTSVDSVTRALAAIKPTGGTNMHDAFESAFRFRNEGLDTIYVLSDGLPNMGPGLTPTQAATLKEVEQSEILAKYIRNLMRQDWNRDIAGRPRVRINTIGFFFESPDVGAFLWALARENDGSFVGMSKP